MLKLLNYTYLKFKLSNTTVAELRACRQTLLNQLHQNFAFAISHSKTLTFFIISPVCIENVYLPRRSPFRFSRAMIL